MKTVHGINLGKALRELSDGARERAWIVSPYIGRWPAITCLLGTSWWTRAAFNFRVITDLSEESNVNTGTLSWLLDRGSIRSLPGVHAKVYIFDNRALVTSANLTETAFTKRREIGLLLTAEEAGDVINAFSAWWTVAEDVSDAYRHKLKASRHLAGFPENINGSNLKPLWDLPPKPDQNLLTSKQAESAGLYGQFLQHYRELAEIYESEQRMWKDAPLYVEVDAFLNFLFHEESKPSEPFKSPGSPRQLTAALRKEAVLQYASRFAAWLNAHPGEKEKRTTRLHTVQNLLAKDAIGDLNMDGVHKVLDCIHAMGALPWPKMQFLQAPQNTIEAIRNAWSELLFGDGNEESRILRCQDLLYNFGPSSTQELLGCFYPEKYPLKNTNVDAGLRFFGYPV